METKRNKDISKKVKENYMETQNKVKKSDYAQMKERINKNAQQMLEICRANGCTVLEVQASVDLLLSYIKQTKV